MTGETDTVERLAAFAEEAARYFANRPTDGEDAAFWANVTNAETSRKIADTLRSQAAEIAEANNLIGMHKTLVEFQTAEIARLRDVSANQGSRLMRMRLALTIAREFGMKNRSWNGGVAVDITKWIDADDPGQPVPWIGCPFFEDWASANGLSNVDGCIGYRATAAPTPTADKEG